MKRLLSVMFILVFVFAFATQTGAATACKFSGKGTVKSPYRICTPSDMEKIREQPGKVYELGADIEFPQQEFDNYATIANFSGIFNGKNHKINHLKSYSGGLFAENYGEITNLRMSNSDVSGPDTLGTIAGTNYGTIRNVVVEGKVQGNYAGMIVGNNYSGWIDRSSASGSSIGKYVVGGIAALNGVQGTITDSKSSVKVGAYAQAGGFVAYNEGQIKYSSSYGDVESYSGGVGGFVASNRSSGFIIGSRSVGNVYTQQNTSDVGQFFGQNWGTINNSEGFGSIFYSL